MDGNNWYIYCNNNPINFVDPWGTAPWELFNTRDEAAVDFGLYTAQESFEIDEEIAAVIYKKLSESGGWKYYYDEPRNEINNSNKRKTNF